MHIYTHDSTLTRFSSPCIDSMSSSLAPHLKPRQRKRQQNRTSILVAGDGKVGMTSRADELKLASLIKKATTSTETMLVRCNSACSEKQRNEDFEKACWTDLKRLLRDGDGTLARQAFVFVVGQLRNNRTEVRERALRLLDRLVRRSVVIRDELASHIRDVLDLCVGTSRCKLPGSPEESLLLKEKGLYALEEWQRLFGEHYPEIRLAYLHLKEVVGASFPDAQAMREREALQAEAQRVEMSRSLAARCRAHEGAMRQGVQELRDALVQMEACFTLIVPDVREGIEVVGESGTGEATSPAQRSQTEWDERVQAVGEALEASCQASKPGVEDERASEHDEESSVEWESEDGVPAESVERAVPLQPSWVENGRDVCEDEEEGDDVEDSLYALGTLPFYEIEVELPWLVSGAQTEALETADLKPVFEQLRELYGVLRRRLLPQIEQWWRLLSAFCAEHPPHVAEEASVGLRELSQEVSTLRSQGWRSVAKCKEIGGSYRKRKHSKTTADCHGSGSTQRALTASTLELEAFLEDYHATKELKSRKSKK